MGYRGFHHFSLVFYKADCQILKGGETFQFRAESRGFMAQDSAADEISRAA